MSVFESLGLQPQFVQAIEHMGFEQPTPIQQEAIPALLNGRSVIGQAQTGTGKTAAFMLPLLQSIQPGTGAVQALVLAPTRELALQVTDASRRLAGEMPVRILTVYGGQSYHLQTRPLQRGVDVVVGTPGRLLDLIRQKALNLSQVRYLVLDEADEMLEMGFLEDVETILAEAPEVEQIALFSATLPDAIRKLANRYLTDPQEIRINPTRPTVSLTEQRYCRVREEEKLAALVGLLEIEDVRSALIFTRTKARAQELAEALVESGIPAEALHGDLSQPRREFVLNRFRKGAVRLLVATDVAARGLDIDDVSHVFNYDAPNDADDYVHRIGRTGRAGRQGTAITFFGLRERRRLGEIESHIRQKMSECRAPTRAEILARRDARFMERLAEQAVKENLPNERALVASMIETGYDPVEIAAAAIRLARSGEAEPRTVSAPPAFESADRPRRGIENRRRASDENASRSQKGGRQSSGRAQEWAKGGSYKRGQSDRRQHEVGMVRLKMNLGNAHGLRPSDVVGAIASEVGIPGRAIGEIDIQRNQTFLDVAEKHVGQVLRVSTGNYFLRGQPVLLELAK